MRFVPDSLAGRIGAVLIAGLVVTMVLTYLVSSWGGTSNELYRIAAVASVANRLPAGTRSVALSGFDESGLEFEWSAESAGAPLGRDFLTRHLAHDLRAMLMDPSVTVADAGYAPGSRSTAGGAATKVVEARFQLGDRTGLTVRIHEARLAALGAGRIGVTLLVLVCAITALALWSAKRLTEPIARFADAAQRLGADVSAPSIAESGPREVRNATEAFNQMQGRIRRFVEDRTLLIAAISHDLRTCLTRLGLRCEYILDNEQRDKALGDIGEMQTMLSATLAFARDDVTADGSSRVDLAVLLQSLVDDASDSGRQAHFHGPAHLVVTARPIALRRIFANLIDNALQYGNVAEIFVSAAATTVEVSIGDRGPGIPEAERDRVFSPFVRLEPSRSRETGGVGLGLAVVRSLVRQHGGEIILADREGGGLWARVALPIAPGSAVGDRTG